MKKDKKRMLIASGIGLAGTIIAGASYATTKVLVKAAVDRDEPKVIKNAGNRISGSVANQDYRTKREITSERLYNAHTEYVEMSASDGTKLVGHLYASENANRIVIAMHGWRSSWVRDFGLISEFLHENKCTVLFAEQRGQNSSGGDHMGFGLMERFDCLEWVNWINRHYEKEFPIYLYGVSMGATTVLMTAGLDLPENVCGIISDCGFTSPEDIYRHVSNKNLHIPYTLNRALISSMFSRKINMAPDDYSTIDALSDSQIPVLLIHGTNDRFVPIEMTYQNYLACSSPKKLLVVPGAGHCMSYSFEPEKYAEALTEFWNEHDSLQ